MKTTHGQEACTEHICFASCLPGRRCTSEVAFFNVQTERKKWKHIWVPDNVYNRVHKKE